MHSEAVQTDEIYYFKHQIAIHKVRNYWIIGHKEVRIEQVFSVCYAHFSLLRCNYLLATVFAHGGKIMGVPYQL